MRLRIQRVTLTEANNIGFKTRLGWFFIPPNAMGFRRLQDYLPHIETSSYVEAEILIGRYCRAHKAEIELEDRVQTILKPGDA